MAWCLANGDYGAASADSRGAAAAAAAGGGEKGKSNGTAKAVAMNGTDGTLFLALCTHSHTRALFLALSLSVY